MNTEPSKFDRNPEDHPGLLALRFLLQWVVDNGHLPATEQAQHHLNALTEPKLDVEHEVEVLEGDGTAAKVEEEEKSADAHKPGDGHAAGGPAAAHVPDPHLKPGTTTTAAATTTNVAKIS